MIEGQSHNTSAVAIKAPHGRPKDCIRGQEIVGKLLVQRDEIEAALVRLLNGSCLSPAAVSRFPIVGVREQYRPTFPVSAATALPAMGSPWLEGADCHPFRYRHLHFLRIYLPGCKITSTWRGLALESGFLGCCNQMMRIRKTSDHLPRFLLVAIRLDSFRFSCFFNESGLRDLNLFLEEGILNPGTRLVLQVCGTHFATYIRSVTMFQSANSILLCSLHSKLMLFRLEVASCFPLAKCPR